MSTSETAVLSLFFGISKISCFGVRSYTPLALRRDNICHVDRAARQERGPKTRFRRCVNTREDILDRISEPPAWFDDSGVPRFEEFSPARSTTSVRAKRLWPRCPARTAGACSRSRLPRTTRAKVSACSDLIRLRWVEYGDPPNVACCHFGEAMTSQTRRILQYWARDYEISSAGSVNRHSKDRSRTRGLIRRIRWRKCLRQSSRGRGRSSSCAQVK